jgi:glycosyltransferase involved in cell wall biosynthesis
MSHTCIIIPAYNEEKRISETLSSYRDYFSKLRKKIRVEILVVINNTTDRTEDIVRKFSKQSKSVPVKYLNLPEGGKGFAIMSGFKEALKRKYDLIGFVDADLATPPEAFHELILGMKGYDGVIASRWMKGSVIKARQNILRRITSRCFNFLVRSILFMRFSDTQCGAKLFRREAIRKTIGRLYITKWAFDVGLLYQMKKSGLKIKEIPTIWQEREGSKISLLKAPVQMFTAIVRIRLINSPFRFIVDSYDILHEKIKLHHYL